MNRSTTRFMGALAAIAAACATLAAEAPPPAARFTLAEAIARAREVSPAIAKLAALESAADAGLAGAKAEKLPMLDVSAGYTRNSNVPEFSLPEPIGRTIFPNIPDNWRARFGVAAPLYTGGRTEGGIDAATGERAAAAKDVEAAVSDLALETTAAYWSLVTARESARVLDEALTTFEAHLADARNRERFGMAASNEVLAVEVERDRAELGRLEAANAAEVAEANLARLLDLAPGTRFEPADALEPDGVKDEEREALVTAALAARPERAALLSRLAAAEARVAMRRASRYPQVAALAGYDYARPNSRIFPLEDAWKSTWSVGVAASLNVFDGGRTSAAVAQAEAQAEAIRRQIADLEHRIRLEVTSRLLDVGAARKAADVAARSLVSASENRRVSADRYKEGVGLSSDLLDAETGLLRAGLDRTVALARVRVALAGLDRAVGR